MTLADNDPPPGCFADLSGEVFLRGHFNLSPVPAEGGALIVILPRRASDGTCACTPEKDVITTTTALAEGSANSTSGLDVCIVRLLVSPKVKADVNGDNVVDTLDVMAVENSLLFNPDPNAATKCVGPCGPLDVNEDGKVNPLDVTSIQQSAALGTKVSCGGVYATAFSCGSSRKAPLTPALGISLDTINYYNDDGLVGATAPLKRSPELLQIMYEKVSFLETEMRGHFEQFAKKDEQFAKKDELHDVEIAKVKQISRSVPKDIMLDVIVSVGVVLVCGVIALVVKRRNK